MSEDLEAALLKWLDTSGRALELRTMRTFRAREGIIKLQQSLPYEDPVTNKQREGDVLAAYHWASSERAVSFEFAIECKSGRANPWIAFYDREDKPTANHPVFWFVTTPGWSKADAIDLAKNWASSTAGGGPVASHAVSALGKDTGPNYAHDAAQQALSFARARAKGGTRYASDPQEAKVLSAVLPIVVTQAPLYQCKMTDDAELELTRVERFDLWIHLDGYNRRRVYICSESALAEMADTVDGLLGWPPFA
ncbi:hypothetical protein GCM10023339_40110 [Alloalcanivorax gelatiniphagus]